MLNKAVEWGYLRQSPFKGVKLFKEPPGRTRFLESAGIDALLRECSEHLRPIVVMAINTGMRLSEILNLQWSDVNLGTRIIKVGQSKNNEPRFIPINQMLLEELSGLRRRKRSNFVFTNGEGKPFVNIRRGFQAACDRAGLSNFRFHDLRHTFASHLVMSGVNLRAVQELMGHKTIKMTMPIRTCHASTFRKLLDCSV